MVLIHWVGRSWFAPRALDAFLHVRSANVRIITKESPSSTHEDLLTYCILSAKFLEDFCRRAFG